MSDQDELVEVYICEKCSNSQCNDKKKDFMLCLRCGKNPKMTYYKSMPKKQYFKEFLKPEWLKEKKLLEEKLVIINKYLEGL